MKESKNQSINLSEEDKTILFSPKQEINESLELNGKLVINKFMGYLLMS